MPPTPSASDNDLVPYGAFSPSPAEEPDGGLRAGAIGSPTDARMERLVNEVADRLERRVIEELERRGRRQSWTAF